MLDEIFKPNNKNWELADLYFDDLNYRKLKEQKDKKKEEKNFSRHKENLRRNARRRGIKRADKAKSLAY